MFRDTRKTFWELVFGLIGHLLGTGVIFVAFLVIAWGISFILAGLDALHKFPPEVWDIFTKIEVWLIYADLLLCTIVFVAGAWRFCSTELAQRGSRL
jgi:hypothetical protein